jgi:hypothetical protein
MSELKIRSSAPLIQILLNDPLLPEKIRQASATELVQWINEIGLEDAGEIIAFANTKQIEAIFDIDLWKAARAGADESFDADRFGTWLEILAEVGLQKAIEKLVEMDEDFLVLAFSTLAWVAETEWLEENCEANPKIEKNGIHPGDLIVIPGKGTTTTKPTETNTQTTTSNVKISDDNYQYITIEPKETVYNLTKKYKNKIALDDFSMKIMPGEIVEYSCAVTPQVRQTGNRLSGLAGTAYASLLT